MSRDFIEKVDRSDGRVYQFKDEEFGTLRFPSVTSILHATRSDNNWFRLNSWKKSMIKTHGEKNFKTIVRETVHNGSNFHKVHDMCMLLICIFP